MKTRQTVEERFLSKISFSKLSTCWLWKATKNNQGYGQFSFEGKLRLAHRFSFKRYGLKDIPSGFEIDHLCRNRACVNPDHLEAVTKSENCIRGDTGTNPNSHAHQRNKTNCKQGHPYNEKNTGYNNGYRRCLECHRQNGRKRRMVKKELGSNEFTHTRNGQ